MKYCQVAKTVRKVREKGEELVIHDAYGNGSMLYAASSKDRRKGINREAVCVQTGDQVDLTLPRKLHNMLQIHQDVIRGTFHGHDMVQEDYFTINGAENKQVFLSELIGASFWVYPVNTPVISTISTDPILESEEITVDDTMSREIEPAPFEIAHTGPTTVADVARAEASSRFSPLSLGIVAVMALSFMGALIAAPHIHG